MSGLRKTWTFILVAAGSGSRMGGEPKQFRLLGSMPVWMWSARVANSLYLDGKIDELIVIFPPGSRLDVDVPLSVPVRFVSGGASRSESVKNGLRAATSDYVMIHDAARPFIGLELCLNLMESTCEERGAIPLLDSVDSLKDVRDGRISAFPRDRIFRTQTPQAFHRNVLLSLMETEDGLATDEASVWLDASLELVSVPGEEKNFKITTDFDWLIARSIAAERRELRSGLGFDVHELVPERKLILGGVEIPSPLGLLGHSDADIICHAMSDALLGAAGEGDIGSLFPASDMKYKNADSLVLMEHVFQLLSDSGWYIIWIDVTLIAQVPRLGREMPKIAGHLGNRFKAYGLAGKMNMKVKSGEFMGSVGRANSMICYASATIERCCV